MIQHKKFFGLGLLTASAAFVFDQVSKWWMLEKLDMLHSSPIMVSDFFNLVMVWNYGISFGMLSGHRVPLLLIVMSLLIVMVLLVWLARNHDRATALGIGLVIGGALGNVIDRMRFGAVADFFDFHAFSYHWPAFNVADASIFVGVVVLCIQSMMHPPKSQR